MCEQFLFDGEMQYSRIEKLSGGEKRRLYLLKVLMEAPNVLILDEPTNDLDIQTLRILEDYLDRFAGIIITVSHDRYFLDRVVTRIFVYEDDGLLHQSEGGYTDLLEHMAAEGRELNFGGVSAGINRKSGTISGGDTTGGKTGAEKYAEQKQENKKKKKLSFKEQREYDHIEDEISDLEKKSRELEEQMAECATQYAKLAELTKEKEKTDARLEERMERYFELQELVEQLEANS
jgi:ATP-binding cassette subfamily F protein uup